MRYVFVLVSLFIATSAMAYLSPAEKAELKQLYGKINASSSPHTDPEISADISRLMKQGCISGANRALAKKNYDEQKKAYAYAMMEATCGCVADSEAMKKGVIDSALLLKQHGAQSQEARKALGDGIRIAKHECMRKIMSNINASPENPKAPKE